MIKKYSVLTFLLMVFSSRAVAYTANQVAFEFRPNGIYRIHLYYTVPDLKEFRESTVEFTSRAKAEKFYFDVVRGADFYVDENAETQFVNDPMSPSPW